MHPLDQHFIGGIDSALASFGFTKEAMSPEEKAKILAAYKSRPKGMSGVAGASGDAELARTRPMPAQHAALPLETPKPQTLSGVGVTPRPAAPIRTTPMNLPTRLASLLLPWPH